MLQVVLSEDQNLSVSQVLSYQADSKFKFTKSTLTTIVAAAQERYLDEEIQEIAKLGGVRQFQSALCTDLYKGLKGDDFIERDQRFGNNQKPRVQLKGYCKYLLEAMDDFIMRILLVAAIFSIIIEVSTAEESHRSTAWIEGFAILVAVLVCANVTAINDSQKERQFQSLNSIADGRKTVTVWRDGSKIDLHQDLVMVGDVVQIFEGMEIPADCLVIDAAELSTDESAMTGETDPMKKDTYDNCLKISNKLKGVENEGNLSSHDIPSPILLSGTRVLSGEGKMLVLVVGDSSCVGKISALLRSDELQVTPLQHKLEQIATDIGKFGLLSALVILITLLIRFTVERVSKDSFESKHVGELLGFIIIAITVIVVAIPEGLPLAVTLSLAYSTKRMLKDNNLVRKISACETMGGANMICSDKTGTLTQNKMTLVTIWNDGPIAVDPYAENQSLSTYIPENIQQLFLQSTIVNSSAMIRPEEKGSKTEIAMILLMEKCGIKYENERNRTNATMRIPFSSKRKRMSMIIDDTLLVIKGASEIVLESCSNYHSISNGVIGLTDKIRQDIEQAIIDMAEQSLRTIGIAYKEITSKTDIVSKNEKGVYDMETSGLTLLGILGIRDILRPEILNAVAQCKRAGIKVRMVTGDNKITARAIAKECGILIDEQYSLVLEGPEFIEKIGGVVCQRCQTLVCDCPRDNDTAKKIGKSIRIDTIKNQSAFEELYPRLDVMARSRPEDKYALVVGLLERGHVVAVTGDGTNDAPALKKADVGFAMGIAGTEVARESASIILLDDNFNSIVKAVLWGRNIYDSIKKFLQFQLTVNLVAVCLTFTGAALLKQEILKPIQMLWVNLIMDTFASLALATETPTEDMLDRKPHNRTEYMISPKMFKHIFGQAIYQFVILIILLFTADQFIPEYYGDEEVDEEFRNNMNYKYSDSFHDSQGYTCPDWSTEHCKLMGSGRMYHVNGDEEYYTFYSKHYIPSRHFTLIFNQFVMLQVFNFINSRKIRDELNQFQGIFSNILFPTIVLGILVAQVLIVTFGGIVFYCYPYFGLKPTHWLICVAFGLVSIIINFILKYLPDLNIFTGGQASQVRNQHDYRINVVQQEADENANINQSYLESRF